MLRQLFKIVFTSIFAVATLSSFAAEQPRLVINIVVSSMQASDLQRYAEGFGEGGFKRLAEGGALFTESRYNYYLIFPHTEYKRTLVVFTPDDRMLDALRQTLPRQLVKNLPQDND